MVLYSIICIVVFGLWYYHSCGGDYLPNPSRTFTVPQLTAVVILVPGMQFFTSYLIGFITIAFPKWWEQYQKLMDTAGLSDDISPLMLCYSVILAPICEELIFRGVTMRQARKAVPFWLANLLQAFLFGLFHMNWIQGFYAFALGLVLGLVCEKGGSIYYSLLFHMLFNFWGTIISQLLEGIEETTFVGVIMLIVMILSLSAGTYLFVMGMRRKEAKNYRFTT
jgi:membrane protease YdiL (CAAX protease family)